MNVSKITQRVNIRPTDRKIKQLKQTAQNSGILPKEMPVERDVYIASGADIMENIKNRIQISIENMRG